MEKPTKQENALL